MANHEEIYQMFKFLEDKEGRTIDFRTKLLNWPDKITKDDLYVDGTLEISGSMVAEYSKSFKLKLPEGLIVNGNLSFYKMSSLKLPNNLTVMQDLDLYGSEIYQLPHNLKVHGTVFIDFTPLAKLHSPEKVLEIIQSQGGFAKEGVDIIKK